MYKPELDCPASPSPCFTSPPVTHSLSQVGTRDTAGAVVDQVGPSSWSTWTDQLGGSPSSSTLAPKADAGMMSAARVDGDKELDIRRRKRRRGDSGRTSGARAERPADGMARWMPDYDRRSYARRRPQSIVSNTALKKLCR